MSVRKIIFVAIFVTLLSACAATQKIEIVDPQFNAGKMKAGESYIAPMDGWFVSDEGVKRLFEAIKYFQQKWYECEGRRIAK